MAFGSILLAAVGIGLLIFLHELGHFLAARSAGVRVEVFSLGFGPRLCGVAWGGTDFRLSLVPFGGFVMVAGQDPGDRRYPARESLWAKSIGQRAWFWSGGVLMNLLFALVAFPIVFRAGVDFSAPVVGRAFAGGAAWEAGLQRGDRIVAVAGKPIYSFENLAVEIALAGSRPVVLLVRGEDGKERTAQVLPQWNANEGRYELGIADAPAPALPVLVVAPGSAAAAAGLQDGDVLLQIDGKVPAGDGIEEAIRPLAGGTPFVVKVRRGQTEHEARITPVPAKEPAPLRIGVELLPRRVAGLRQGLPFLEQLGLRRGDVLLAIDGVPFTSGTLEAARTGPERLRVHVLRDGREVVLDQRAGTADRAAFADGVALRADDSLLLLPRVDQAAAGAGVRPGDRIESVDGRALRTFDELRQVVEGSDGKPLAVVVRSAAAAAAGTDRSFLDPATGDLALTERRELTITPRRMELFDCGLSPQVARLTEEVRAESLGEALRLGTALSLDMVKQLYVTMKRMVTGDVGAKNLGGIIRISQVSYQAAQRGPTWFLYLLAMLSLNLAFVNLLPVPVLDGGHLLFLLIEKVKGSPVSTRVFGYSQVVGLVFVLMLVLFVTYNDILQLL